MSVFKSKRALFSDYTPSRLPHRERHLKFLRSYFEPILREGGCIKVHVYGPIGTGKTVLCNRFGRDLEAEASRAGLRLKYVHINLAYMPKPYQIVTRLLDQVSFVKAPRSGLSPGEMLTIVTRTLIEEDYNLVLALDEIDTYINEGRDPKILYMFSRLHELHPAERSRLSLIYISRSLDWMKRLDEATLDTLGRVSGIELNRYGLPELRDILRYRAEEAFQPDALSPVIIDFISDIAIHYGGIRYALELLLEAGIQADADRSRTVGAEHVRRAHANIPKGVNGAYYPAQLSLHKQLLLSAIIQTLQQTNEPYAPVRDIIEEYHLLCEEYNKEPENEDLLHRYLKDLKNEGYILTKEGELVGTEFPVDRMVKSVEIALKQTLEA